jgi:hypothetical protein
MKWLLLILYRQKIVARESIIAEEIIIFGCY